MSNRRTEQIRTGFRAANPMDAKALCENGLRAKRNTRWQLHCAPGHIDAHGDLILDGDSEEGWAVDVEVGTGEGNGPGDAHFDSLLGALKRDLGVVIGLAGELNFEVGVNPLLSGFGLREMSADLDERELCALCRFDHVQVAIGVTGVEGFDGDGDEEIAPAGVANTLTLCSAACAVHFVHGMRHVIAERALIENPLRIGLRAN